MKNKLNKRNIILLVSIVVFLASIAGINFYPNGVSSDSKTLAVKKLGSQILADGIVESKDTSVLRFQVGGKLAYLPFKEGDRVYIGQTVAQLDTYVLQRQLSIALNNYRSTRDTFDQTKDNTENNLLVGQQRYAIERMGLSGITNPGEIDVINDIIKRIVDQNQAALDNSVANVELANYALQLSSLTSPINGVITHMDVNSVNVNVTPATSFIVSDPDNLVFNANVSEAMINYISVDNKALVKITNGDQVSGTVTKIYPQKFTLPNGESVYKVEITADKLIDVALMGQSGTVIINSNLSNDSIIVPTWTVLGKKYIWVENNGNIILRNVTVGKIMGYETEIVGGLESSDQIILNPKSIVSKKYKLI